MSRKKSFRITFLRLLIQFIVLLQVKTSAEDEVNEDDDELISQLLDTPIGTGDDSEVSKILKVLEAAELASTTTTTTTPPPTTTVSTTTPKPTTTTPKPSPFFNTESPLAYSSRLGKLDSSVDDIIPYLGKELEEVSQWIDEDKKNEKVSGWNRRSDNHEPPVESLLWSTARAVWEVSRPVFFRTKAGRKISLLRDTLNLPLRTIGAVKSHVHDLKYHGHHHHHHHPHDKRSVLHHHPLDHGWGWDPHVVYVKYEPENSLFKSWLRFFYRVLKPAALTKLRLKKLLIRIKLRFLIKLVHLVKSAKLHKLFATLRAISTKLLILKSRKHPSLVVLKEAGTTKAPVAYGWGWGWHPPPHHPPPVPVYGPPPTKPPPPQYGPPSMDLTYGPPAKASHGYHTSYNPSSNYGPPPTTEHSLVAYNSDNTYSNYRAPPSQWLVAPEPQAVGSQHHPQEIDAPSYAKYLQQFGINPSSLSDASENREPSQADSLRYLRQSETDSSKELEVPYLISNSTDTEDIRKRM